MQERRYPETLATVDVALENFPLPDGRDTAYACEFSELFLAKGISHFNLKEWSQARQAFQKVIDIHPWPDSQNVQSARRWLGYVEARKIDPQDAY
jgi:TolA-binding protein